VFGLFKRKEAKEEFNKISDSFKDVTKDLKQVSSDVVSNKEKIARLEGAISVLLSKSQSQISTSVKKSQSNIETKIINRVRRSKKVLVMAEINKLSPSMSVIEMYDVIVLERGLCSKASFYRYIQSLKSQDLLRLRQK